MSTQIPDIFKSWFEQRGWLPFSHQLKLCDLATESKSALLIAPTGAGKTLAGFLPSLIDLYQNPNFEGLHTLYISPLKALAVDIERNVMIPIQDMDLKMRCETRTGDTPAAKRQRQRHNPPHILMTTPESLALMLSYEQSDILFGQLKCVVLDELHALYGTRRGDLLSLGLTRLKTLSPDVRFTGLSATVADPQSLADYMPGKAIIVKAKTIAEPDIQILNSEERLPWSGHSASYAVNDIYKMIKQAQGPTIVFVNTRAQAEMMFQHLWTKNDDHLKIALHHGSLSTQQRRKVESHMSQGSLDAVVATSSLDLGIDWGDVSLVIQVGAPKGSSRLLQRIGRANHRMDEPSRAVLVPCNRFEVLECQAVLEAIRHNILDGHTHSKGGLDILAQHILGSACANPINPDILYKEVIRSVCYKHLTRDDFEKVIDFVQTGGYALSAYNQFQKLIKGKDGLLRLAHKSIARQYRMNVGTIVEATQYTIRFRHKGRMGRKLGQVEEYFIIHLTPGDTFTFAGQLLKFEAIEKNNVLVSKANPENEPKIPAYAGGRLPISPSLAEQIRAVLASPLTWENLPEPVHFWLTKQKEISDLPPVHGLLVETFERQHKPRHAKKSKQIHYLIAYCFEGRNAHQTLGMLLTRRMERKQLKPLGFVANDYVIAVWGLNPVDEDDVNYLFDPEILGDDLEEWMAESAMLKRTFAQIAIVSGLIERRHPGHEKTGRQVLFSTDLIYDVLRKHEPDHLLIQATQAEAAKGLTDIRRLSDMLNRIEGHIHFKSLQKASPLSIPILLEVGREPVWQQGSAGHDMLSDIADLEEMENELTREAMEDL